MFVETQSKESLRILEVPKEESYGALTEFYCGVSVHDMNSPIALLKRQMASIPAAVSTQKYQRSRVNRQHAIFEDIIRITVASSII